MPWETGLTDGETHRVYWQQSNAEHGERLNLITSSLLVKISNEDTAKNVCALILASPDFDPVIDFGNLVLVGTLYSLPRDYVQFEHDPGTRKAQHLVDASVIKRMQKETFILMGDGRTPVFTSEPVNLIRTLSSSDYPLQVLGEMEKRLNALQIQSTRDNANEAQETILSPKLRWFFVPEKFIETAFMRPCGLQSMKAMSLSCVDVDGYCTSMEDVTEREMAISWDEDDDMGVESQAMNKVTSVSANLDIAIRSHFTWLPLNTDPLLSATDSPCYREFYLRQQFLSFKFKQEHSFSGFLLKQCTRDSNVWRCFYCKITTKHLWFSSRVYKNINRALYGRINLNRALVLGSNVEHATFDRIPYGFGVVTASGNTHAFRANSQSLRTKWIKALNSSIAHSFENSLIDAAEQIISSECSARSRRLVALTSGFLWQRESLFINKTKNDIKNPSMVFIRWALDIAEYRDSCLYVDMMMSQKMNTAPLLTQTPWIPPDKILLHHIQALWTQATALLARATHAALRLDSSLSNPVMEACQHVEFILTTHLRRSQNKGKIKEQMHDGPPPTDLFDLLLTELQGKLESVDAQWLIADSKSTERSLEL